MPSPEAQHYFRQFKNIFFPFLLYQRLKISVNFNLIVVCPVSDNLKIVLSLINFVFLFNGKKVVSSILLAIAMKFEIPIS